jgi:hypothetical protein
MNTAKKIKRFFASMILFIFAVSFAETQSAENPFEHSVVDSHTDSVTCLVQDENGNIVSSGEDGFINIWNIEKHAALSRFQLSPYPIVSMAKRPGKNHIAIIESDEMGIYRISAWDYLQNKKLFTLRFKDKVSYITYSKNGSFLIVARNGKTGTVFINPENGDLLQAPQDLNGTITFAATGKSERTMIAYSSSGTLSYWNLETGSLMQQVTVPHSIQSPLLFNNNLFFAGIDNEGLVIVDALSGRELSRNNLIKSGELLVVSEESSDLICIQKQNEENRYILFRMDNSGNLRIINQEEIPKTDVHITSSMQLSDQFVFGTNHGKINVYNLQNHKFTEMQTAHQLTINEITFSGDSLAVLNHSKELAFIPADFNMISTDTIIQFEEIDGYDKIATADIAYNNEECFVLWNSNDASYSPIIRNKTEIIASLEKLSKRYTLRTVSILNNLILFLDTNGNISLYNINTQNIEFQHNTAGALHASFINEKNIIIARSANAENTPFLMLNTLSGETVPLAYPADIGMKTYTSKSGTIYATVVNQNENDSVTSIINIDTFAPNNSRSLIEYQGEDTNFSIAEYGGNVATNLGGDGATLFTQNGFNQFERSSGLPENIVSTEKHFTILDNSNNIVWHNFSTGEIEATLRFYDDKWYLQKKNGDMLEGMLK